MKPITTTLNSYNNKIRQTQQQPNKYNTTTNSTFSSTPTTTTPTRAQFSRSSDYYYYYHFALTKPSCTPMIIGLKEKTAHSLQRQSTDDKNNDENENCTNPTQKTKMKTNISINGLISATKFSMMIKMMKAKKYLMKTV